MRAPVAVCCLLVACTPAWGPSPAPPSVDAARVEPDSGDATTRFRCIVDGITGGELASLVVAWSADGLALEGSSPLPAGSVRRGQALACAVTVADRRGRTAHAVSAPVVLGNAPPALAAPPLEATAGGELVAVIAGSDADGDPLEIALSDLPDNATSTPIPGADAVVLRYRPGFDPVDASPSVRVVVSDGVETIDEVLPIVVVAGDRPPEFDLPCDLATTVPRGVSCELAVHDPDGTEIAGLILRDAPPFVRIDPSGPRLVATPGPGDAGHYAIEVEAFSGPGSVVETFDLEVSERVPLLTEAVDEGGATLATSASGLPTELDGVTLEIAPGVFREPATISVSALLGAPNLPAGTAAVDLTSDVPFDGYVVMTLDLPEGRLDERVHTWDEGLEEWVPVGTADRSADGASHRVALTHFSSYCVANDAERKLLQRRKLLASSFEVDGTGPVRKLIGATDRVPWRPSAPGVDGSQNVLMVHGWGGSPREYATEYSFGVWAHRAYPDPGIAGAGHRLSDMGGEHPRVMWWRYPSGRDIAGNARALKRHLNQLHKDHPGALDGATFDVVGFSMGGVIARSYLALPHPASATDDALGRDQIRNAVSINSPHLGVDARGLVGVTGVVHAVRPEHRITPSFSLLSTAVANAIASPWNVEGISAAYRAALELEFFGIPPDDAIQAEKRQLHTGAVDMLAGLGLLPIGIPIDGTTPSDRFRCFAGIVGNPLSSLLGTIIDAFEGATSIDFPGDLVEAALESDLVVPLASQVHQQGGVSRCANSAIYDGYVHVAKLAPWEWNPLRSPDRDFCGVDDCPAGVPCPEDFGNQLRCWLGYGGPSCTGDGVSVGAAARRPPPRPRLRGVRRRTGTVTGTSPAAASSPRPPRPTATTTARRSSPAPPSSAMASTTTATAPSTKVSAASSIRTATASRRTAMTATTPIRSGIPAHRRAPATASTTTATVWSTTVSVASSTATSMATTSTRATATTSMTPSTRSRPSSATARTRTAMDCRRSTRSTMTSTASSSATATATISTRRSTPARSKPATRSIPTATSTSRTERSTSMATG